MRHAWFSVLFVATGCASGGAGGAAGAKVLAPVSSPPSTSTESAMTETTAEEPAALEEGTPAGEPWVGAAAESDVLLTGTADTALGVWVDVPSRRHARHVPVDLALLVDTSGSMRGSKIESARLAAKAMIRALSVGDRVTIDAFSDHARPVVRGTEITEDTRATLLAQVDALAAEGGTNMYEGLVLAETHALEAPSFYSVRRVVMISDGQATVGITSPQALGEVAERGLQNGRVQVTSLGVGVDYDARTLDALAERTSGRLYHLGDPGELERTIAEEVALLGDTVASEAFVEVVPAPDVSVLQVDGGAFQWSGRGAVRIPLGALHTGQHREALVRVRVDPARFGRGAGARPLASVQLRFRDPTDGDVERVQEVVARAGVTGDAGEVARHANARTQTIASVQKAARLEIAASEAASRGDLAAAQAQLASAESTLRAQAASVKDESQKKRLTQAAGGVSSARASAVRMAAAPPAPAARRDEALKMNSAAMDALGY